MSKLLIIDNIKNGTGQTTLTAHLGLNLVLNNKKVIVLYRATHCNILDSLNKLRKKANKPHYALEVIPDNIKTDQDWQIFIMQYKKQYDYIIIDSIKVNYLYYIADDIITPIADSIIDINTIAKVESKNSIFPSSFTSDIWRQRIRRFKDTQESVNWFVVLNRYVLGKSKNRDLMIDYLQSIAKKFGATYVKGMSNRSIFQTLFYDGNSVFDSRSSSLYLVQKEVENITRCIE